MTKTDAISFQDAKARLKVAMAAEGDVVQIDRATADTLQRSWPPNPPADLSKSAVFSAQYMNFLRPVVEGQDWLRMPMAARGITVVQNERGGVTLSAINGPVMVFAHDWKGAVTEGGMCFEPPLTVFDACVEPEPFCLQWEGEECPIEGSVPEYARPGLVHATGVCLLVMPADQPEGTEEDNGGALFSRAATTSRHHRRDDYRIGEPFMTNQALHGRFDQPEEPEPIGVTPDPMRIVAQAMAVAPSGYWHMHQVKNATCWLHSERKDLVIVLAGARTDKVPPVVPEWLLGTPL